MTYPDVNLGNRRVRKLNVNSTIGPAPANQEFGSRHAHRPFSCVGGISEPRKHGPAGRRTGGTCILVEGEADILGARNGEPGRRSFPDARPWWQEQLRLDSDGAWRQLLVWILEHLNTPFVTRALVLRWLA